MVKKSRGKTLLAVGGLAAAGVITGVVLLRKPTTIPTPPVPPAPTGTANVVVTTSPEGGQIILDGTIIPSGTTVNISLGTHNISTNPTNFQGWSAAGGVSVANSTQPITTITIQSNGGLNASFTGPSSGPSPVPPPPVPPPPSGTAPAGNVAITVT